MTALSTFFDELDMGRHVMVKHIGQNEWREHIVTYGSPSDKRMVLLTPDQDHYVWTPTGSSAPPNL
jgi:hypothetical protein